MRRLDLYGECNLSKAPMEMFSAQCCAHCMNPECTRSRAGKSQFEHRTATWYDRLFANVPRMVPDDARYGDIAGQRFLLVNPAIKASSDWVEVPAVPAPAAPGPAAPETPTAPQDPPASAPPPSSTPAPDTLVPTRPAPAPSPQPTPAAIPQPDLTPVPAEEPEVKVPPKSAPPRPAPQRNTAVQRGQMLPGASAQPDQVVRPGARIKLP